MNTHFMKNPALRSGLPRPTFAAQPSYKPYSPYEPFSGGAKSAGWQQSADQALLEAQKERLPQGEPLGFLVCRPDVSGMPPAHFVLTWQDRPGECLLRIYDPQANAQVAQVLAQPNFQHSIPRREVRLFDPIYAQFYKGASYDRATLKQVADALSDAMMLQRPFATASELKVAVKSAIPNLARRFAPAENEVSEFFKHHAAYTPRRLVAETACPSNQAGEGGQKLFYSIRHPDLAGYGLLVQRANHSLPEDFYRRQGFLKDEDVFEPIHTHLAGVAGVGDVVGRIGRAWVVKTVPGDPLGSYFDLPLKNPAAKTLLHRGHYLRDLSPPDRLALLALVYAGDPQALRELSLEETPDREEVRRFETAYVTQMERISRCSPEALDGALDTMGRILARGYQLDCSHNLNTLLSGEGESARFGFIDLQKPRTPRQIEPNPLTVEEIRQFALNLVGGGTDFYGSHWLVTDPACVARLKEALPRILENLRAAAQRRGMAWNPAPLQDRLCQKSAIPDLNQAFLPQP